MDMNAKRKPQNRPPKLVAGKEGKSEENNVMPINLSDKRDNESQDISVLSNLVEKLMKEIEFLRKENSILKKEDNPKRKAIASECKSEESSDKPIPTIKTQDIVKKTYEISHYLSLGKIVGTGSDSGGLYLFDIDKIGEYVSVKSNYVFVCHASSELWHYRLGHPTDQVMSILGKKLGFSKKDHISPCDICHKAKQTRERFPLSDHKSKFVGDIIHCDVWGPYRVVNKDGYKFFLTLVDDFSRAVWVYLLKSKTEIKASNETSNGSDKNNKHVNGLCDYEENNLNFFDVQSPERSNDKEGDSSNVEGNTWVTSDDYDITVEDEGPSSVLETSPVLRRSTRQRVLPSKFNDYVSTEPKTFHKASQNAKWIEVMTLEMEALHRNNTHVLADLPPGRKAIGCKSNWKIKYKSSGEIDRYKARLVAKGFSQREGIDYEETFNPVVKMVTIRCLIALFVQNNWPLYQLDMNNAFLYGDLNEEVYIELPPGYYDKNETKVCKLVKSLYGLKQAPTQWNEKLTTALIENDFVQSKNDYSLYVKSKDGLFIAILVYVDDIVIKAVKLASLH
ncbi:ribonuclease H-like domain-containing protein, partial [Tanacetum coccineum]